MLKLDDIKGRVLEACQRGKTAFENTFIRRHNIPGGAVLVGDCVRAMVALFNADGYAVQSFDEADEGAHRVLVQIGRKHEGWEHMAAVAVSGQDFAVNIKMVLRDVDVNLEITGGRWIDKMFSGIVAWSLAMPLVAFPVIGVVRQRHLIDRVEMVILKWFETNHNRLGAIDV